MTNQPVQTPKTEQGKKRRRLWLLLILLLLVAISFCIVGYILGQRTAPANGGAIVDTIVLTPTDPAQTAALPLSLSGVVRYPDGTPYANGKIELHSAPRATTTDSKGRFLFYDVEEGRHRVQVVDDAGHTIAQVAVILAQGTDSSAQLTLTGNGEYQLSVSVNVLLVELEIELDAASGTLSLNTDGLTSVAKNGFVTMPDGSVSAAQSGVVLTPQGTSVYPDGTISVPFYGVILNDGIYIAPDGTVTLPAGAGNIAPSGVITLVDGTVIAPGGLTTLPNGETISVGQLGSVPAGVTVDAGGMITLPDSTTISPDGTVTLPGGTTVLPGSSITFPGGETIDPNHTKITLPNDTIMDVASGEGTLPDGTVIGDHTVTQPDGSKITPPQDGGYIVGGNTNYPIGGETAPTPGKTDPAGTPHPSVTPGHTDPPDPSVTPATPAPSVPTDTPAPSDTPDPPITPDSGGDSGSGGSSDGGGGGEAGSGDTPISGSITVTEGDKSWTQLSTINLFAANNSTNPDGKLYPGVEGSYAFHVSNTHSYDIRFRLSLSEAAADAIPFEYRLKTADGYVDHTWRSAAGFASVFAAVGGGESITYTLEWRWPYERGNDALDTRIGLTGANHTVNIVFYAEQVVG